MAKSVADITKNYSDFSKSYREYLLLQGTEKYDPAHYRWFRPPEVTDTTDLDQISSPFTMEELDTMAKTLVEKANIHTVNAGDYALVVAQQDAILSCNRSYANRHKSKLRHFAHANGIAERIGHQYGTFHFSYDMLMVNIKRQASLTTQ